MKRKRKRTNPFSLARYLRTYLGLTQQAVASAVGLSANQVCQFELGRRNMSIGCARRLAAFFKLSIDDLAHDRFAAVLPNLPPRPKRDPSARKRMEKRMKINDKLGRDGEAYVARLERDKLAGTPFANGVNEACADDPTAGFDMSCCSYPGIVGWLAGPMSAFGFPSRFLLPHLQDRGVISLTPCCSHSPATGGLLFYCPLL